MNYITLVFLGGVIMSCAEFGTRPTEKEQKKFSNSKNYNIESTVFENRRPKVISDMKKESMNFGTLIEWFRKGENRAPKIKLPEIKPDLDKFLLSRNGVEVIWFGHSTFLLNFEGTTVLVDPVFSKAASPFKWMVKRFQPPVLSLQELPKIDYIVISHDHYDHLDRESIVFFKDTNVQFLTPLGVSSHLKGWGVKEDKITELDWWESSKVNGLEFIATPSQHFSGRDGFHENETLWASWVIKSDNHNIYFSGDSGYDTHFKEIGDKYGPFDMAFIESGQYNEKWKEVHLHPHEGVKAYKDLQAKSFFPVHWGMFELAFHQWNEPVEKLFKLTEDDNVNLIVPKLGEAVSINKGFKNDFWWRQI